MLSNQIHEFSIKAMAQSEAKVKKAFFGLGKDIVFDTPVDKGMLINGWIPSKDSPNISYLPKETDRSGQKSISHLQSLKFKLGDTLYLTNNLPYAERIEFEGWSKKAPQGMVRRNIVRWRKYFD